MLGTKKVLQKKLRRRLKKSLDAKQTRTNYK